MESEKYHGWKNRQTWNVALWIRNDSHFYTLARSCNNYKQFVNIVGKARNKTPDGIAWNDHKLDLAALDSLIRELKG